MRVNYGMIGASNAFAQKYSIYGDPLARSSDEVGWRLQDVWSGILNIEAIYDSTALLILIEC
jgi:hypothetical protein